LTREAPTLAVSTWPEWTFFGSIVGLLRETIEKVRAADTTDTGSLFPWLDSVAESTASLELLAREQALRDAYVIARVIYETALNACFVLTEPARLSERADRHAKQKALRSLVRRIEIAGQPLFEYKHSAADQLMMAPQPKQWLEEFTSGAGREITSWTPETVQQRLEAVYRLFGPDATKGLAFGLLLYRHASEIAHGTLYGTLFSWGALDIGRPLAAASDIGAFRRTELRHVLKLVSFTLESLIRIVSVAIDKPFLATSAEAALRSYYANLDKTS